MPRTDDAARVEDVGGFRLRVAVREGARERTPLLLMNGSGASLETFQPFIDALDPSLTVIRFDPPGVGGSPPPARRYRLPALARALGQIVDDMGHPQVDVLGISWGGALAQQFAFTQRRRCRRLVLVATSAGAVMVPASPLVLAKMATPRRFRDPDYLMGSRPTCTAASCVGAPIDSGRWYTLSADRMSGVATACS